MEASLTKKRNFQRLPHGDLEPPIFSSESRFLWRGSPPGGLKVLDFPGRNGERAMRRSWCGSFAGRDAQSRRQFITFTMDETSTTYHVRRGLHCSANCPRTLRKVSNASSAVCRCIAAVGWMGTAPAMATSLGLPGPNASNTMQGRLRKSAIGAACTGAMPIRGPTPTTLPRMATIRLLPHTPTLRRYMATSRLSLRTPTLHPCMAIRPLRRLRMAPLRRLRMAPILPRRVIMGTIRHQRVAITRTTRRMVLS